MEGGAPALGRPVVGGAPALRRGGAGFWGWGRPLLGIGAPDFERWGARFGGLGGAISALERAEGWCICLDSDAVESMTITASICHAGFHLSRRDRWHRPR